MDPEGTRLPPDHHVPWTYLPPSDEPVDDVRILTGEIFRRCRRWRSKDQQSAVRRIAKRTSHHDLPARVSFVNQAQMFRSMWRPAIDKVFDDVVAKDEVRHRQGGLWALDFGL